MMILLTQVKYTATLYSTNIQKHTLQGHFNTALSVLSIILMFL